MSLQNTCSLAHSPGGVELTRAVKAAVDFSDAECPSPEFPNKPIHMSPY